MDDMFASQSLEGGFQGFLADSTMGGSLWILGCTLISVSSPCGLRIVFLCQGEHRGVRLGRRRLRLSRGALPCPIRREVRPDIPLLVGSSSGYGRREGVTWGCPRSPPLTSGVMTDGATRAGTVPFRVRISPRLSFPDCGGAPPSFG